MRKNDSSVTKKRHKINGTKRNTVQRQKKNPQKKHARDVTLRETSHPARDVTLRETSHPARDVTHPARDVTHPARDAVAFGEGVKCGRGRHDVNLLVV